MLGRNKAKNFKGNIYFDSQVYEINLPLRDQKERGVRVLMSPMETRSVIVWSLELYVVQLIKYVLNRT